MLHKELNSRCAALIDLAALERNLGRIRNSLPPHIRYISVVKADAYGHGLAPMATRLMQINADAFAVASIEEAKQLRELGLGWPILILSPLLPNEYPALFYYDLIPTLSSLEEMHNLAAEARRQGQQLKIHLNIDTGMGRAGVWHEQFSAFYQSLQHESMLHLHGIYTHLSSADSDPDYTQIQRERFLCALAQLPQDVNDQNLWIHADNSAGLESFHADSPYNAVRIGLLQFGLPPRSGSLLEHLQPEPVLSLHSKVCLVKKLPKGTSISYGRTYTLQDDRTIAVISAGYGDGLSTQLSNRGQVLIQGERCPIIGKVTMDQSMVDVSHLGTIHTGEPVVLLGKQKGEQITASELAEWACSIPWEIFCHISKRVPRQYITDRPPS